MKKIKDNIYLIISFLFHYIDLITDIYLTFKVCNMTINERSSMMGRAVIMIIVILFERCE